MIPLRLELQNFLPYVDPDPLDFSGLHVVCLTGDNGAGKSSLLDAMTWALWGRARAKTDEELIHQGASEMRVAFTFELNGQVFQVIRQKRAGKGRGSTLELQQQDNGKWKGIGDATINATQRKIVSLLKLDYETFCNSAFLQQGKADEFTRKTPTQRKEVLADILGLDQWGVYEDRAKKKISDLKEQIAGIDGEMAGYDRELARRTEYELQMAAATAKLADVQGRLLAAQAQWAEVEKARDSLNLLKRQIAELDKRLSLGEKELAETESELRVAQAKGDPEALARELESAQDALAKLEARESERTEITSQRQAAAEESARRKGENDTLGPQTEPLKKRIETLSAATAPVCPTCGQPLTEDHRHAIIEELTTEVDSRRSRYRENTTQLKTLSEQLANLDRRLTQINADLRERPTLQKKLADLQGQVAVATEAQAQVEALRARRARQLVALQTDRAARAALDAEAVQLASKAVDADDLQNALDKLRFESRVATEELGAARQRLAALDSLAKYRADKLAARKKLADEQGIYEELREAFSKRGVPAMIIEAAVPEIENAANDLLRRMTAGRMNVRFNTQRETQAGDVRETLDIQISDELGTRAYENYSIDGNEPVYIRRDGKVACVPVQDLWSVRSPINDLGRGYETQCVDFECLCYQDGKAVWLPAESILRHPSPSTMLKVTTAPGNYSVALTPCHSIFVMTPDGLAAKRGDELKPGDWILTPRRMPEQHVQSRVDLLEWIRSDLVARRLEARKQLRRDERRIWSRRDQPLNRCVPNDGDLAEFLGTAAAEASGQTMLTHSVGGNRAMAEQAVSLSKRWFGVSPIPVSEIPAEAMARYAANAPDVSSKTPQEQFRPLVRGRLLKHIVGNLIGRGAENRRILSCSLDATHEAKRAFLKALIAGGGNSRLHPAKSQAEIGITTTSPGLVADAILLCRQLGVWACVEQPGEAASRRGTRHRPGRRFAISGQWNAESIFPATRITRSPNQTKFEGIPLPLLDIKRHTGQKRLPRTPSDARFDCGASIVPKRSRAQYERVLHWLEDWAVLEVACVETVSPLSPFVYDLVVPHNHSFVAGTGLLLVHNSGGEQFRVNFAIRIALSRLLARRAGAQLQTLIVDEGFGSQDTQGREKLVEAINAIQEDFARILIITHLDDLKDAFPARIDIVKSAQGSQISVA